MTGVNRRRTEIGRYVSKVMGMKREGSGTLVPKVHVTYISVGCPCPSCRVQLEGSGYPSSSVKVNSQNLATQVCLLPSFLLVPSLKGSPRHTLQWAE